MTIRTAPLTLDDLWRFLDGKTPPVSRPAYADLVSNTMGGHLWGLFDGDDLMAFGGIIPVCAGGPGWAGFDVVDAARLSRHTVALVRAIRRHVDTSPFPFLFAFVRDDNPAGQRIGRIAGFYPTDVVTIGSREWHTHGRADRIDGEEAIQAGGGGAGPAGGPAGGGDA